VSPRVGVRRLVAALALLTVGGGAWAQSVSGTAFEDRDGDGVREGSDPPLPGIAFRLLGIQDAGGAVDATSTSDPAGAFGFSPGNGCYVLQVVDPPGWRMSGTRSDGLPDSSPGYVHPVGIPRVGKLDHGIDHLVAGTLSYASMGDSIAWNWNSCLYKSSFWYSSQVRDRLACAAPGASITLLTAAQKGEHTDDLLVNDTHDDNNVFRMLQLKPQLITLSMIGNDLLDAEPPANPTQDEVNRAVAEILDSRRNLQEAISILLSGIPDVDITVNTLYDNLAYNCYASGTDPFHRAWLPIVDRILRDLAWGQVRRVGINEIATEFAHEDQAGECTGFDAQICRDVFQTDQIHPNNNGYTVVREKVWEADGGVSLGPKDALGRTARSGVDYGFLRRVRRLLPTAWEVRGGATVADPDAALDDDDGGASASITLGIGQEEFRLSGFPDWFDEIQTVRAVAGIRYHTTGTVTDDFYRIEASPTGEFQAPPGFAYAPTNWNFYTPIVGGGGPNQPPENPDYPQAKLLAVANIATPREVSATLTKNPVLPPGAADYEWPPVTPDDLTTSAIRVVAAPVAGTAGNDAYQVALDAAWIDLYGWEKPRPAEVGNVQVDRLADGTIEVSFDEVPGAERYNLYLGRISTLAGGTYDHGRGAPAGPLCAAPTESVAPGRLKIVVPAGEQPAVDAYVLVTAHVDGVESPAGRRSDGTEIDRSQAVCR
jgi:lysophospholipase L1-like esterase